MTAWRDVVPSRDQQHEMKRTALLREAAAAFTRNGFHATQLTDIAKKLGVTKAALYHYFPNKHALLNECFEYAMDAAFESYERACTAGKDGREKVVLTLRWYIEEMIDELSCCVLLTEESALLPDDRAAQIQRRDRFEAKLRGLVAEGIADGSIVPCDPKLVVFALLGAVNWVPKWFRHDGAWDSKQLAVAMTELLERALSSAPAPTLAADVGTIELPAPR